MKNIYTIICLGLLFLTIGFFSYSAGKRFMKNKEVKTLVKQSENKEKLFKDSLKILKQQNKELKEKNEKVKYIYLEGKKSIKYITKERISTYTDTFCKEDVINISKQIDKCDELVMSQESLLDNNMIKINLLENIIQEKEKQISGYKSIKPKYKPIGIGLIGGYGSDFNRGLNCFIGVGISYNIIKL